MTLAGTSAWERWTIDEIDEDVARVLVAQATDALADAIGAVEQGVTAGDGAALRTAVAAVEMSALSQQPEPWSEETQRFYEVEALRAFLKRRDRSAGLPADRDLREGDVFYVQASVAKRSALADYDVETTRVLDVTAAARQRAKRAYDALVRSATAAERHATRGTEA